MKKIILILLLAVISLIFFGCGPSPLGPVGSYISPIKTNTSIVLEILTPGNFSGIYEYGYTVNNIVGTGDTEIINAYMPGRVEMNINKLDPLNSILQLNVMRRDYFDDGNMNENILITGETVQPNGNVIIQGNI